MGAGVALLYLRQLQQGLENGRDTVQLGAGAGQRLGAVLARGLGPIQIVQMHRDTLDRGLQVMRDIQ